MGKDSGIEWTDHTFNPWWGCAKISPACDSCYAEAFAHRVAPTVDYWQVNGPRREFGDAHWNEPIRWNRDAITKGLPPPRVFCASMADVFDKQGPRLARVRLWDLIRTTPGLRWLLLTKRIGNARAMLPPFWCELNTAALGITVANPWEAERDIPKLTALPAPMRFLSIEPMLEHIDLAPFLLRGLSHPLVDWVIVGGESGPRARPVAARWVRNIRNQCRAAGVAFFFKQWGEWIPAAQFVESSGDALPRSVAHRYVDNEYVLRVGKKRAGRELDGETHSALPAFRVAA